MERKNYPRVTEVLAKYMNTSFFTPEACERGTIVHAWCALYAQGLWMPKPKLYVGYCDSYQKWFDETVKEVVLVEKRFDDDIFCYKGTPDQLLILKGDQCNTLLDIKTSKILGKLWEAQIAAYSNLLKDYKPKRFASLRVNESGEKAKFQEYKNINQALGAFLNALHAHKYFIEERKEDND